MTPLYPCTSPLSSLGNTLLVQLFLCYVFVIGSFFLYIPLAWGAFPAAILIGGCSAFCSTKSSRSTLRTFAMSVGIWVLTMIAGTILIDFSYDGNAYHQEIIAAVLNGWNPLEGHYDGLPLSIWSRHYAKAFELSAACVSAFTGHLESGKAINYILAISATLIACGFVAKTFPSIKKKGLWLIVIVILTNPVFLCQSMTYYIDFTKYFYSLISIVVILQIGQKPHAWLNYILLIVTICLGAGTKFNIFFEEGVIIFAAIAWWLWRKSYRVAFKVALTGLVGAIMGGLVLGYHPYITNFLDAGHPLFPLMGEGAEDIMTGNTPDVYLGSNRFANFFRSLLTPAIQSIDAREGGFGVFMPLLLVISLIVVYKTRKSYEGLGVYISLWILASCFFFEQSWWARYICQLWIVVVIGIVLCADHAKRNKGYRYTCWILTICAAINGTIGFGFISGKFYREYVYRQTIVSVLEGKTVPITELNEAYRRQLAEKGIKGVPCELKDTVQTRLAYYGFTSSPYGFPIMQLDSVQYSTIIQKLSQTRFDYTINIKKEPFEE